MNRTALKHILAEEGLVPPEKTASRDRAIAIIPKGSLVFHGTVERRFRKLKDNMVWFADTPSIAQLYIRPEGETHRVGINSLQAVLEGRHPFEPFHQVFFDYLGLLDTERYQHLRRTAKVGTPPWMSQGVRVKVNNIGSRRKPWYGEIGGVKPLEGSSAARRNAEELIGAEALAAIEAEDLTAIWNDPPSRSTSVEQQAEALLGAEPLAALRKRGLRVLQKDTPMAMVFSSPSSGGAWHPVDDLQPVRGWQKQRFTQEPTLRAPPWEDLEYMIEDAGWAKDTHGMYDIYTSARGRILPPTYQHRGRLFAATLKEDLKVWRKGKGESQLLEYQHLDFTGFKDAARAGLDGVLIDDFAQSKKHGNVGHMAIGIFDFSLDKLNYKIVPAQYREWERNSSTPDWPNAKPPWFYKL